MSDGADRSGPGHLAAGGPPDGDRGSAVRRGLRVRAHLGLPESERRQLRAGLPGLAGVAPCGSVRCDPVLRRHCLCLLLVAVRRRVLDGTDVPPFTQTLKRNTAIVAATLAAIAAAILSAST